MSDNVERHYLIKLVRAASGVSLAADHPASETFGAAAQAWWEAEVREEGLIPSPDYGVLIETSYAQRSGDRPPVLMVEVTGEVLKPQSGDKQCARMFPHEGHTWAKLMRDDKGGQWTEPRVCAGR